MKETVSTGSTPEAILSPVRPQGTLALSQDIENVLTFIAATTEISRSTGMKEEVTGGLIFHQVEGLGKAFEQAGLTTPDCIILWPKQFELDKLPPAGTTKTIEFHPKSYQLGAGVRTTKELRSFRPLSGFGVTSAPDEQDARALKPFPTSSWIDHGSSVVEAYGAVEEAQRLL